MESMSSSSMSSFGLLVLVTFLSCLWLIFHFKTRSTPRGPLPPGNLWLIPLMGETLQLLKAYRTENPEPFIDQRVRKHGSVFTTHIFGEKTIFLADPIANKAVLHNKGGQFECSYPTSIAELLGKHSLLITTGPSHKRLHSLTLTAFSSTANLRDNLLPNIDRLVRLNLNSWENNTVIRLHEKTKKITFDLAVKQLLSLDPGKWSETLRKEFVLVLDGFFSIPIRVFTLTAYAKAVVARRTVAEALREAVRERKEDEKKDKVGCIDMLGILLEEGEGEDMVVDFLVGLLVAGYETTSTIMTLAIKYLTHNCSPNAIALLKEEHEAIRARKEGVADPLNWNDYKHHMSFTHCVINETLRMANIISGVFRRAMTDVQINGYTIPKGCKLFTSFRGVHLDSNHYDDARTFNPWRWQQNEQQPQHEQQNHGSNNGSKAPAFTPFGGGQRLCPGYELSKLEICVFLHYFLSYFSWEEEGEDKVIFFPTTRTVKGYPIRIRRCHGSL